MFLKDLIGKKVLSHDGKLLGYSRAAIFSANFRRIVALLCADEDEEDFLFPLSAALSVGDALIMPRRPSAKSEGRTYSPLLKQVYTVQGKFLGCVSDLRLEKMKIIAAVLDDKELPADKIKAWGDCLLYDPAPKTARARRQRGEEKEPTAARPVILLGRTLRHDVKKSAEETLFAKGTRITPAVLRAAALHKKLVELTAKTLSE